MMRITEFREEKTQELGGGYCEVVPTTSQFRSKHLEPNADDVEAHHKQKKSHDKREETEERGIADEVRHHFAIVLRRFRRDLYFAFNSALTGEAVLRVITDKVYLLHCRRCAEPFVRISRDTA